MAVATSTALLTAAIVGGGAFSAVSQAKSGRAQAKSLTKQGEYNAQIYEQQASMIQEQKKLQSSQFYRMAARTRGSIVSRTAGAGFDLGGSPLAILADSEGQMLMDQAVGNYNLDVDSNLARSGAGYSRGTAYEQARLAKSTGYTNAFSTVLNTGATFGMLNMPLKTAPKVK